VKGHILVTTSVVLLLAVMVTLNLNSAVWAKDGYKTDLKTFRHSEMINGKVNTDTNGNGNAQSSDNGNIQTSSDNGNIQTSSDRSFNCKPEPECRKTFNDAMGMLNSLIKPTLP
jgi:hypothetical protein